jgi:hypothetical protein
LRKFPVTAEAEDAGAGKRPSPGRRWRRRWRYAAAALVVLLAPLTFVTARWYVWPQQRPVPSRVDAIVMLDGPGDRLDTALDLAWAHEAPVLVISRGSTFEPEGRACAPKIPRVRVICFDPNPATTRGEAEFAGRLAARYHWRSIVIVAITPQDTVARLRVGRCFDGNVYLINSPLPAWRWPVTIVYEWGSTLKALFLQRSC